MEFSLPEFPTTPTAQAATLSACLILLIGAVMLVAPRSVGRVLGLASSDRRPGAIGEIRVAGGFLLGFALACLMMDQPVLYATLGLGVAMACFGRLLALMSDQAASVTNFMLLFIQAAMAAALVTRAPEAFADAGVFQSPVDLVSRLVLGVYGLLGLLGLLTMFMPRIAARVTGLSIMCESGHAPVRSAGGLLLGLGLVGAYVSGLTESMFVAILFLAMATFAALVVSIVARLISLVLNRGNLAFSVPALVIQAACAGILISSFISMI